jgi:serpin B
MDGASVSTLKSANRLWVRSDLYPSIPSAFVAAAARSPGADVALFPLGDVEAGRAAINDWVAQRTGQSIREVVRRGGITPTTTIALTSTVHFQSPWAQPFDAGQTAPRSFQASGGLSMPPTMTGVRAVRKGVMADEGVEVLELPFADKKFALTVVMPAPGHSLAAVERRLSGIAWVSWGERLSDLSCRVHLPRFVIGGDAQSLKSRLAALGVSALFRAGADFGPMLGSSAASASVADLVQAARVSIDESGGEASAATAATVWAKSMPAPVPDCAVDRAFLFAITHAESRTPIFMGRVSDPAAGRPVR